eukprot:gene9126-6414_t
MMPAGDYCSSTVCTTSVTAAQAPLTTPSQQLGLGLTLDDRDEAPLHKSSTTTQSLDYRYPSGVKGSSREK